MIRAEIERDRSRRPRIGFLGVGWIGRHRLEAIARSEHGHIAFLSDPDPAARGAAAQIAPQAAICGSLEEMLERGAEGIVIATPSASHAEAALRALRAGAAVFCQKPLGRSSAETRELVAAAREADRLLEVDLSYRQVLGVQRIADLVRAGELGEVYAAHLVFHNAYGPDKPWFYDPRLSGGGCLMDLGIHLLDLALWTLGFPGIRHCSAQVFVRGKPLKDPRREVEDYAAAQLELSSGASVQLCCSWNLPAGRDAIIEASFYGTRGGAALRNMDGSFYDFIAERYRGTAREVLAVPPDAWGGRAAAAWAERLARGARGFDPAIERAIEVARGLERIYGCAS